MRGGPVVSHDTGGQKLVVDVVPGKVTTLRDGVTDWSGQNVTVVEVPSVGKTVTNGDGTPFVDPAVSFGAKVPVNVLSGVVVLVKVLSTVEFEGDAVLFDVVCETPLVEDGMPEADLVLSLLLVVLFAKGGAMVLTDVEWEDETEEPWLVDERLVIDIDVLFWLVEDGLVVNIAVVLRLTLLVCEVAPSVELLMLRVELLVLPIVETRLVVLLVPVIVPALTLLLLIHDEPDEVLNRLLGLVELTEDSVKGRDVVELVAGV